MWTWSIAAVFAVAALPDVQVQLLSGEAKTGRLVKLSAGGVVVHEENGADQTYPLDGLQKIAAVGVAPKSPSGVEVELQDGGRLFAQDASFADGKLTLKTAEGASRTLPAAALKSLRLRAQSNDQIEDWKRIQKRDRVGDLLVVKKADALDFLEGTLVEINAERMPFKFEGETIGVSRQKAFGVVFQGRTGKFPKPAAAVFVDDGGQLPAAELEGTPEGLKVKSLAGAEWVVPWEKLSAIDFSHGKVVPLGELAQVGVKTVSDVVVEPAPAKVVSLERMRINSNFDGGKIKLRGKEFARGVCLRSRAEVVFHLGGEYSRFEAVLGVDDAVGRMGAADVQIFGDDRLLYAGAADGGAEPILLKLPIEGCQRLRILVDFGKDSWVADYIDFADARVIQ